ncbi:Ku protein [Streptomyces sp. NPDC059788]|uniref:Ku protein n=1 Tax=Streptomyces sp. NPDC059788 TaxID=3346948 RepID=UPI00365E1CC7
MPSRGSSPGWSRGSCCAGSRCPSGPGAGTRRSGERGRAVTSRPAPGCGGPVSGVRWSRRWCGSWHEPCGAGRCPSGWSACRYGCTRKDHGKVYALLHKALKESNRAGVATFVLRNRACLVAVRAEGDVLALHTLHWADEIRDPHDEIGDLPGRTRVAEREL